jgi:hypothetical protein
VSDQPSGISSSWKKSSFSQQTECVEVRRLRDVVQVRDSKDPGGPVLRFTDREWRAFLAGATAGEFAIPE